MIVTENGMMRTHTCGELTEKNVGQKVTLCGWVNKYRDLGGLHFIDLRDKFGITQLGFEQFDKAKLGVLKDASLESVVWASGVVTLRPESAINDKMETGRVEVAVHDFKILSIADKENIPFLPSAQIEASENLRLKYRYLDLRTKKLQNILKLRADISFKTRKILMGENFVEVETPVLYKTTPEGARDYIVPSRVHPGKVYALPQSPQTLKQLLMIGGTDRYFQITKCFRDEDLRPDRQPEFTQIDIETSFSSPNFIKYLAEKLMTDIFNLPKDFKLIEMKYSEAIRRFGSDKPDMRFGLEHLTVTDLFANSTFATFASVASALGLVKAIFVSEKDGSLTRKDIDGLVDIVKPYGGKGVAWFKSEASGVTGGISKFITPEIMSKLQSMCGGDGHGIWLFCADNSHDVTHACADALRRFLGQKLKLIQPGFKFLWVTEWPLLQWDEEEKRFAAVHHPFTRPHDDDLELFMSGKKENLAKCRAQAYDVVCNGYELGGGSMRIFDNKVQDRMFETLGLTREQIDRQFGFFIEALKYGVPPHGGIAFGLDRIVMLLAETDNIKDVIAFPKTNSAADLMANSPSAPEQKQLNELKFKWNL